MKQLTKRWCNTVLFLTIGIASFLLGLSHRHAPHSAAPAQDEIIPMGLRLQSGTPASQGESIAQANLGGELYAYTQVANLHLTPAQVQDRIRSIRTQMMTAK